MMDVFREVRRIPFQLLERVTARLPSGSWKSAQLELCDNADGPMSV